MAGRDYLSYSQLSSYLNCPLKHHFQYVMGLKPEVTAGALLFGGAIHRAIAFYLQSVLQGEPLPAVEVTAYFEVEWAEMVASERTDLTQDERTALEEVGKRILAAFVDEPQPAGWQLVGIEEPFAIQLAPDLPPLVGTLDALFVDKQNPNRAMVVDFKTASASYPEGRADHDLQLTAYSLALVEMGYPVAEQRVGLTVLTKTKIPKVQRLEAGRSPKHHEQFVRLARQIQLAIASGVAYPRRDFHCHTCPYKEPCRQW